MQKSQRLILMMMRINAKKSFTVKELADEFGLSTRTIARDLQELGELGVPIYSIQGRGGGYRLLHERLLPPISFTESEAVAIFFACRSLKFISALPFDEGGDSALDKFYHHLPADTKKHIDRLENRIMIWSPYRWMSPEILQTLLSAIMMQKVVSIEYKSSTGVTRRNIQPIGIYASSGFWYCPSFCFLKEDIRQFRADRILSASFDESVSWREDINQLTLLDKPTKTHLEQTELRFTLTMKGVWILESDPRFAPFIRRNEDGSGHAVLHVAEEDLQFYVDQLWKMAEDAQIVGPDEAILLMKQKVEAVQNLYT